MPRRARIIPECGIVHIISRGNNKQNVFRDELDFSIYFEKLRKYRVKYPFKLYHYCLMKNHVHLLMEINGKTDLSSLMKVLNQSYMYHYRNRYGYIGHFWQDRFKSLIVQDEGYLLRCGRYIELNPVTADIVTNPEDYPWSSCRVYLKSEKDSLIELDPMYLDLGSNEIERQRNYRKYLKEDEQLNLNAYFVGGEKFVKEMEEKYKIKNLHNKKGRPKNVKK